MTTTNINMYTQQMDGAMIKEIKSLNEKIEKESNPEELQNLFVRRMECGLKLNAIPWGRPINGYYPF